MNPLNSIDDSDCDTDFPEVKYVRRDDDSSDNDDHQQRRQGDQRTQSSNVQAKQQQQQIKPLLDPFGRQKQHQLNMQRQQLEAQHTLRIVPDAEDPLEEWKKKHCDTGSRIRYHLGCMILYTFFIAVAVLITSARIDPAVTVLCPAEAFRLKKHANVSSNSSSSSSSVATIATTINPRTWCVVFSCVAFLECVLLLILERATASNSEKGRGGWTLEQFPAQILRLGSLTLVFTFMLIWACIGCAMVGSDSICSDCQPSELKTSVLLGAVSSFVLIVVHFPAFVFLEVY